MFGLFRKRDQYPELSVADRLLIAERNAAHARWSKAIDRKDKLRWGRDNISAYAQAVCDEAHQEVKRLDAEWDAMRKRLTAEAAALIQAAKD